MNISDVKEQKAVLLQVIQNNLELDQRVRERTLG